MDYGHDLHFGVFLPPLAGAGRPASSTRRAGGRLLGLDSVSVQDHPYQPAYLDAWTLLTHIAARTERVTVFPNVANLPLRPPAVLAPQRRVASTSSAAAASSSASAPAPSGTRSRRWAAPVVRRARPSTRSRRRSA